MNEDRAILSATELQPTKCTFQRCIYCILISVRGIPLLGVYSLNTVSKMAIFKHYAQKSRNRYVILPPLVLAINRKSHIVDLLQSCSLGAFIHSLLSHAYLCISNAFLFYLILQSPYVLLSLNFAITYQKFIVALFICAISDLKTVHQLMFVKHCN